VTEETATTPFNWQNETIVNAQVGNPTMSTIEQTEVHAVHTRARKLAVIFDRVGLGLIYAFIIAMVPITAVGLFSGTV
jgi:hypothetical protein